MENKREIIEDSVTLEDYLITCACCDGQEGGTKLYQCNECAEASCEHCMKPTYTMCDDCYKIRDNCDNSWECEQTACGNGTEKCVNDGCFNSEDPEVIGFQCENCIECF